MSLRKPLLYSCWMSSCAWRVRIALNLKKIAYDIKTISIHNPEGQGDQHSDEFQKINPMKHIPALQIDGHTLIESLAIINYLEEAYPKNPILPRDLFERAQVRAISDVICSGIQPLQNLKVQKYSTKYGSLNFEWANYWISQGFSSLNKILEKSAGDFCSGNEITMADCCLIPQIANAKRYKVDVKSFLTISRIEDNLKEHEAFKAAHPFVQPDFPKDVPQQFMSQFQ